MKFSKYLDAPEVIVPDKPEVDEGLNALDANSIAVTGGLRAQRLRDVAIAAEWLKGLALGDAETKEGEGVIDQYLDVTLRDLIGKVKRPTK